MTLSDSSSSSPARSHARATLIVAGIAALIAVAQIAFAAWIALESWNSWVSMSEQARRNSMFGPELGYWIAGIVAAPSVVSLVFTGFGTAFRARGVVGLALAITGLVTTTLVALLILWMVLGFMSL